MHQTNIPQCTILLQKCARAHFCYKMFYCEVWHRCILGFVRWVYTDTVANVHKELLLFQNTQKILKSLCRKNDQTLVFDFLSLWNMLLFAGKVLIPGHYLWDLGWITELSQTLDLSKKFRLDVWRDKLEVKLTHWPVGNVAVILNRIVVWAPSVKLLSGEYHRT